MLRPIVGTTLMLFAFAAAAQQPAPAPAQTTTAAPARATPAAPAAPGLPAVPSTQLAVTGGTLYGTLLLPDAKVVKGKVPVVLVIAGSGPTDRNGNSNMMMGSNNSLKMFAEGLAANGIASLRYDKRGIGESAKAGPVEADLRFENFIDDAAAWCNQLRHDERFSRVVIAGHSEGSLIGMVAAKKCNADAFISLEGAGRPAGALIRVQVEKQLPLGLVGPNEAVLKELEAGRTTDKYPEQLSMLYRASVQPYLISWFKYDPAKEIASLKIPVMIVQGTTDIQTSPEEAKLLAAAAPTAKVLTIENMNHVLKTAPLDRDKQMAAYTDPNVLLAESLIPGIVQFIRMK